MGALHQCASRLQITESLPVLPDFEAPPPPARQPTEDEHQEEEEDQKEGQGQRGPDEAGQGDEKEGQDEGMDEGEE